jgi:23S rRNA pseudouridine1911/1915/1917 synthase
VAPEETGTRLDRYLADHMPELTRSAVQRLIKDGAVAVDGTPERASYNVVAGDRILALVPEAAPPATTQANPTLRLLFEDDSILVVDKPAGLVVHGVPGHDGPSLAAAALAHRPAMGAAGLDPERPGIVHRLDKDTSGVLVVAATRDALAALQRQFRRREVSKQYLAIVHGVPAPARAAIEAPIARDEGQRTRMSVSATGRYARTEYVVVERFRDASLLAVDLLTGRTHQIRVHLAAIGHPVIGDTTYGRRHDRLGAPRQMLHSHTLALTHPVSGERLVFTAEVPADMETMLARLRG